MNVEIRANDLDQYCRQWQQYQKNQNRQYTETRRVISLRHHMGLQGGLNQQFSE